MTDWLERVRLVPESLFLSRTYVDTPDTGDYGGWSDDFRWAACGHCGWNGPSRRWPQQAERDRWRHPNLLCWAKASWFNSRLASALHALLMRT